MVVAEATAINAMASGSRQSTMNAINHRIARSPVGVVADNLGPRRRIGAASIDLASLGGHRGAFRLNGCRGQQLRGFARQRAPEAPSSVPLDARIWSAASWPPPGDGVDLAEPPVEIGDLVGLDVELASTHMTRPTRQPVEHRTT
jgi:hypothetical protein